MVCFCKTIDQLTFMLIHSASQIVCNANIHNFITFVCQNVNIIFHVFTVHRPARVILSEGRKPEVELFSPVSC